ncbi:Scr1 family TA system antitoxin-like transcriptional regulator [Streptomyces microflavus]|uniref:Scr1 family TA system antitoxin-like transcriptional regulator n=1 Tax=Streptomyces microflavus TaxID=1919 RepID=UPI00382D3C22
MILPEEPAELLGITPQGLLALEKGRSEISTGTLTELTGLYQCEADEPGLRRLLAQRPEWNGMTRDREPGHARRLAACTKSAGRVRWLSHEHLPAPLQTPHYAHAVAEPDANLPGAPGPPATHTVYVLDHRVLHHGGGTARLMAAQLDHLLHLTEQGTDIRVLPARPPRPQPAGHIVEITLPAGRVLARPAPEGVEYCRTLRFAAAIDTALGGTDRRSSREALYWAAASHHARAGTSTAHRAVPAHPTRTTDEPPRTPGPAEHPAPAHHPAPARSVPNASVAPRGRHLTLVPPTPLPRWPPPGPRWAAFRTAVRASPRPRSEERRPRTAGAQEETAFFFRFCPLTHPPRTSPRGPAAPMTTNGHPMPSSRSGLANLPVIPKGTQLEGANRAKFLQQILPVYDSGASIRAISEHTQRSYGAIQSLLRGAGVLRGRGGGPHQRRPRASGG